MGVFKMAAYGAVGLVAIGMIFGDDDDTENVGKNDDAEAAQMASVEPAEQDSSSSGNRNSDDAEAANSASVGNTGQDSNSSTKIDWDERGERMVRILRKQDTAGLSVPAFATMCMTIMAGVSDKKSRVSEADAQVGVVYASAVAVMAEKPYRYDMSRSEIEKETSKALIRYKQMTDMAKHLEVAESARQNLQAACKHYAEKL